MEIVFLKKADQHRSPNMCNISDKKNNKNVCKKHWYSHDFHLFHYIEFETNHQSLSCIYTPVSGMYSWRMVQQCTMS